MRKFVVLLLAVLAALVAVPPALAQVTHIRAALVPERTTVAPGETVTLAVTMRPEPRWHGYWENPGDAGFGMSFKWSLPPGAKTGVPRYPVPETLLIAGLMNHVYEHDYALLIPFTVPADARPGTTLALSAQADWLACTDEVCVPERGRLETTLTVGSPGKPDARFDGWRQKMPAPLTERANFALADGSVRLAIPLPASLALGSPHLFLNTENLIDYAAPQGFRRKGDLLLVDLKRSSAIGNAPPQEVAGVLRYGAGEGLAFRAGPGAVASGGTPLVAEKSAPTGLTGLVAILGGALLGGLLLNVMPCVFPILSLKALSLASANASPVRARADGLAYTAGVVLACLALGGLLLGLRASGEELGWAFQLQEPLVVAGLLLLAVAITANLAGLFELPSVWTGGSGGERGAFATGLLAAFVATPCTGPFMAAAMGAALVLPLVQALAVFAALGLGLALPFLDGEIQAGDGRADGADRGRAAVARMADRRGGLCGGRCRAGAGAAGGRLDGRADAARRQGGDPARRARAGRAGAGLRAGVATRCRRAGSFGGERCTRLAPVLGRRAGYRARLGQAGAGLFHRRLVPDLQGQRGRRTESRNHPRGFRQGRGAGAAR